jgi:hypothetical protein
MKTLDFRPMPYEETEAKLASYSLFGGWPMVRVYSLP